MVVRTALMLVCVSGSITGASGQWDDSFRISREEAREDLDSLQQVIMDSHTDPFGFISREIFEAAFDSARKALPDSIGMLSFTREVAGLLSIMRDSHSSLNFYGLMSLHLRYGGRVPPFRVYSNEEGIWILEDKDRNLKPGWRLLSIAGHPADSLWREVNAFACIEGNAYVGNRRYTDAIFPLMAGMMIPPDEKVQVDLLRPGLPDIYRHTIRTDDRNRWQRRRRNDYKKEMQDLVRFSQTPEGVAVLRVETFDPPHPGKYAREIRQAFASMSRNKTTALVLDLRDNGGGSSAWVEYLYSFIEQQGYNTPHNIILRNSALARHRMHAARWRLNRFLLRTLYRRNEDVQGFLSVFDSPVGLNDTIYFSQPTVQRNQLVYTGPVMLLINGLTASASVDFSNHFRRNQRGVIAGEPCFGPPTGTWGNPAPFELPHSGIPVFISTIRYNYDPSFRYAAEAIEPDIQLPIDPAGLGADPDPAVRFAIDYFMSAP